MWSSNLSLKLLIFASINTVWLKVVSGNRSSINLFIVICKVSTLEDRNMYNKNVHKEKNTKSEQ